MVNVAAILYGLAIAVGAVVLSSLVSRRDRKTMEWQIAEVNKSETDQEEKSTLIQNARAAFQTKEAFSKGLVIAAFAVSSAVITFGGIAPAFVAAGA
jgi:hypothetical protein